jgi:hypothetical protein
MNKKIIIIQANPGFFAIYKDEKKLHVGDAVIAWAISYDVDKDEKISTIIYPIAPDGDVADNLWGILQPDGHVIENMCGSFPSLVDAQKEMDTK